MVKKYIPRLSFIVMILMVLAVFIKARYRVVPQNINVLTSVLAGGAVALALVIIYLILFKYRARG